MTATKLTDTHDGFNPLLPRYAITPGDWPRTTMRQLADFVCRKYDLTFADLKRKTRARRIEHPRQEFMALAYDLTSASYSMIARFLGLAAHSSVWHGIRSHKRRAGVPDDHDRPSPRRGLCYSAHVVAEPRCVWRAYS